MSDEERHADEVIVAYMLGVERQKKRSDSAWKGIHEGAVLALQAHIEQLEAIMQKLVEPFKKAAPLFGAQHVRSIKVGDQVVEELLAALEGEKDE